MTTLPSIACLAVIGKNNNPLHIAHFPSTPLEKPLLTALQTSLVLAATLDIFEARAAANQNTGVDLVGDYGLLHAIDERLAAYGFETNTGVRFIALVDLRGRLISPDTLTTVTAAAVGLGGLGLRDGDLKVVFRAMQSSYIRLLQNPFFVPDEYLVVEGNKGGKRISSPRFIEDLRKIGENWVPEGMGGIKEKIIK